MRRNGVVESEEQLWQLKQFPSNYKNAPKSVGHPVRHKYSLPAQFKLSPLFPTLLLSDTLIQLCFLLKKNKEEMYAPRSGYQRNELILDPIIYNPEEEFPYFDEGNPREWVRSCNKYFQRNHTPENVKMAYVALNLERKKIFQRFEGYMRDHGGKVSWAQFSDDICTKFGLPGTTAEELEYLGIKEIKEEGDKHSETREEICLVEKFNVMSANTLKFLGKVNQKPIVILIDTGSTHSFLSPKFAENMGLQSARIRPFQVAVASGVELICDKVCPNFKWTVQGETFEKHIFLLELNGCTCNMVLGMDWVDEFAPLKLITKPLSISFHRENRLVTLYGILPDSVLKKKLS